MATQVQNRRGTTAEHSTFTGAVGELTVDTTKDTVVVHDGAVAGGRPLLREDQSNLPTSAPTTGIYSASGSLAISTNSTGRLFVNSSGSVGIGTSSPGSALDVKGTLRLSGSTSGYVGLAPAAAAGSTTYTLPSADGTSGQVLSTNGSGTLSWATAAAGGASVTTSDTPPVTPNDGDLWYDSAGGRTYVYYQDPNGSQWVDASPQGGGGSGTSITTGNTTAEVIDTGSDGRFVVTTEGTEALRVDSSRRLLVGTSSARANFYNSTQSAAIQVEGTGSNRRISVIADDSNGAGAGILLGAQRSNAVGGNTIVANNEDLGTVTFQGNDGTEFVEAAAIIAQVDGTPGANDMPGRLVFSTTADGASSPTERMRIDSTGLVTLAGPGIKFPATQVASADANVLDDYEEGTWTASANGGSSYSSTTGYYVRIGSKVFISWNATFTSSNPGGGSFITGLPYASSIRGSAAVFGRNTYTTDNCPTALIQTNGVIYPITLSSGNSPNPRVGAAELWVSGSYIIA